MEFKAFIADDEYNSFIAFVQTTNLERLDEIAIPQFLADKIQFVKELASAAGKKIADVVGMLTNKLVFGFFKALGFSLKRLVMICREGYKLYVHLIRELTEYVHKTRIGKSVADKAQILDEFLKTHPKFRKYTGPAVAGLLIVIWILMTHTGDVKRDFDLTDAYKAMQGEYSVAHLFAGPEGTERITLFMAGVVTGLSFPWPIHSSEKLAVALIHSLIVYSGGYKHAFQVGTNMLQRAGSAATTVAGKFAGSQPTPGASEAPTSSFGRYGAI